MSRTDYTDVPSLTDTLHLIDVEARHADGFVVRTGGDDVTGRIPGGAVDGTFVVLLFAE